MYELAILLSQWTGAIFILLGIWKMESKSTVAPLFIMIGGTMMLIFGVLVHAWGVVLVNSVAVVLNYRCWRRWRDEEKELKIMEDSFEAGMGRKR